MTSIGRSDDFKDNDWLGDGEDEDEKCPAIDIRLLVEPIDTARQSLRCSDVELQQANKPRRQSFDLGWQSAVESEQVTLRSNDETLLKDENKGTK